MKMTQLSWAALTASTLASLVACDGSDLPSESGDGDTVAAGDGDTSGDGETGDGDMTTGPVTGDGDVSTPGTGGTTTGPISGSGGNVGMMVDLGGEDCATPAALSDYYQPYGWMGDQTAISLDGMADPCEERSSEGAAGDCYKVGLGGGTGTEGWAGVFWLNAADNWGVAPGCDFSDNVTVRFMAKGAVGGEQLDFFVSDIPQGTLSTTTLTDEWAEYSIDVSLSAASDNIWGGFGFSGPTETSLVFYVDDVQFVRDGDGMGGATN